MIVEGNSCNEALSPDSTTTRVSISGGRAFQPAIRGCPDLAGWKTRSPLISRQGTDPASQQSRYGTEHWRNQAMSPRTCLSLRSSSAASLLPGSKRQASKNTKTFARLVELLV